MDSIEFRKVQGVAGDTSLSLVLPRKFTRVLHIQKGDVLKVGYEGNKIVVEKV